MPRRPPPTSLRLVQGPVPLRSTPKHTLPSMPRPAFHPQSALERASPMWSEQESAIRTRREKPALCVAIPYSEGTPLPQMSPPSSSRSTPKRMRGPWDHSGSIALHLPFDTEGLLAPLKPVVISPSCGWRGQ